jgi:hydroxymethylbilane synthase
MTSPAKRQKVDTPPIVLIGSRKSVLALWQTKHVKKLLEERFPDKKFEIYEKETHGDLVLDKPLVEIGSSHPGLFTKDLEVDLLSKRTRLAVHSLKDMPTSLPAGLMLGCITQRENPADAVIVHPKYMQQGNGQTGLEILPEGAIIGTSSLRREALLRRSFPTFKFKLVRGNIHTRIRKLEESGEYDAIILAAVGLRRVGLGDKIAQVLSPLEFPYSVSQGALGVECHEDDHEMREMLSQIEHEDSAARCKAERSVLRSLEGGCQIAMGVVSSVVEGQLKLGATILSRDGSQSIEGSVSGACKDAENLGQQLADVLKEKGAKAILGEQHAQGIRPTTYGNSEDPQRKNSQGK